MDHRQAQPTKTCVNHFQRLLFSQLSWRHKSGDPAEIEAILDSAGDVASQKAQDAARAAIEKLRSKAGDWIAKKCKGSINSEFPSEFRNKTLEQILKASREGEEWAKKAWKLLNDNRFKKP
jgi:hypothetical protein